MIFHIFEPLIFWIRKSTVLCAVKSLKSCVDGGSSMQFK